MVFWNKKPKYDNLTPACSCNPSITGLGRRWLGKWWHSNGRALCCSVSTRRPCCNGWLWPRTGQATETMGMSFHLETSKHNVSLYGLPLARQHLVCVGPSFGENMRKCLWNLFVLRAPCFFGDVFLQFSWQVCSLRCSSCRKRRTQ